MPGKIVVVLIDNPRIRADALTYGLELAARTTSALVVLIILSLEDAAKATTRLREWLAEAERSISESMRPHLENARQSGVEIDAVVKLGVPSSELMKFVAETSPVHTIVWGGEPTVVSERGRIKRGHWLAQMRETLHCPIVIPRPRENTNKTNME